MIPLITQSSLALFNPLFTTGTKIMHIEDIAHIPYFYELLKKVDLCDNYYLVELFELGGKEHTCIAIKCPNQIRLIIKTETRIGYHDKGKTIVLIDLSFDIDTIELTNSTIFTYRDEVLTEQIAFQEPLCLESDYRSHVIGKYSSLEIKVETSYEGNEHFIVVSDKKGKVIFEGNLHQFSSDPLVAIKGFLIKASKFSSQKMVHSSRINLLKIFEYISAEYTSDQVNAISYDLQLIEKLTSFYYFELANYEHSIKTELLLTKIVCGVPEANLNLIPETTECKCFLIQQEDYDLLFKTYYDSIHQLNENTIQNLLKEMKSLCRQKKPRNAILNIIVNSTENEIQSIENYCKFIATSLEIPVEILIIKPHDSFPFYKVWKLNTALNLEVIKHALLPTVQKIVETSRMNEFTTYLDEGFSYPGHYIFYGTAPVKTVKGKTYNDYRLMQFTVIGNLFSHSISLIDIFEDIVKQVKGSIENHKYIPTWNRIFIKVIPILNEDIHTIESQFRKIIQKFYNELKKINIQKILLKCQIIDHDEVKHLIVDCNNILFDNMIIESVIIKDKYYQPQVFRKLTGEKIKAQVSRQKNVYWINSIPGLFHRAARDLRERWTKNPKGADYFQILDIIPESTRINPMTQQLDPNFGELGSQTSETTDFKMKHNITYLAGLIINDLGHGILTKRLLLVSDISNAQLTPAQCTFLNAAIKYSREHKLPIDWLPISFGAKISMDNGVENLDACATTAREIVISAYNYAIPFNLIIDSVNVGAQSYWNALSSILPKTTGITIMTTRGSMVLTGDRALTSTFYKNLNPEEIADKAKQLFPNGPMDYGGYKTVYGNNGEITLYKDDLLEAVSALLHHHAMRTGIHVKRHGRYDLSESEIKTLNEMIQKIRSGRIINQLDLAQIIEDKDCPKGVTLWKDVINTSSHVSKKTETLIREMQIGGYPVMAVFTPIGPLSPADSEIIAKAIYKAYPMMPVVIIGSLSGYQSDLPAMLDKQLECGARIVEAIVRHKGPVIVVNMGIMIGGIAVTFSKELNPNFKLLAVEGSKVQVIGSQTATKIIFNSRLEQIFTKYVIEQQSDNTPDSIEQNKIKEVDRKKMEELVSNKYDLIHNVERAKNVGAVDHIIKPENIKSEVAKIIQDFWEK